MTRAKASEIAQQQKMPQGVTAETQKLEAGAKGSPSRQPFMSPSL